MLPCVPVQTITQTVSGQRALQASAGLKVHFRTIQAKQRILTSEALITSRSSGLRVL